eukprot:gene2757-12628_t
MDGTLNLDTSLEQRLNIINCTPADVKRFLVAHPPDTRINPGIKKLINSLRARGVQVYFISGGFREILLPIAKDCGIPYENIFANRMNWQWDDQTGEPTKLVGFDFSEPTSRNQGKPEAIARIRRNNPYNTIIMVGDGITDLEAVQGTDGADMFIGYGGNIARPAVAAEADWFVAVVGSGAMACAAVTAMTTNIASEAGSELFESDVSMWIHEEEYEGKSLSEVINETNMNSKYFPGFPLGPNVKATNNLTECVKDADVIVFCAPHQHMHSICKKLIGKVNEKAIGLSLTKGMRVRADGPQLISGMINKYLGIDCSVLMGANFASDIGGGAMSEAVIGYYNRDNAKLLVKLLERDHFHLTILADAPGAEMCGTLKNSVAIAAGLCDGLGYNANAKATILRQGLEEMKGFSKALYPTIREDTFLESCGLADLIATCYGGRNRECAEAWVKAQLAGTPKPFEQLELTFNDGQRLKGLMTTNEVYDIIQARGWEKEYPLFTTTWRILNGKIPPSMIIKRAWHVPTGVRCHTVPQLIQMDRTSMYRQHYTVRTILNDMHPAHIRSSPTVSVVKMQNAMLRPMTRAFNSARPMPAARPIQAAAPRRVPLNVQALRVNNVEIPNSKRIQFSLQYIYGVGSTTAKAIVRDAGVENKKVFELSEGEINTIREEVSKYTTESDLRRIVTLNIKRLKDIQCYRGKRHLMGLPVRGQNTKNNARTRKGKVKTVAGKKKLLRKVQRDDFIQEDRISSILRQLTGSKCNDAGFCRRNLRKTGPQFSLDPGSVVTSGSSLEASLLNDAAGVSMFFKLTAYEDGFVRLTVDEAPEAGRYKILDLVQGPVESRQGSWHVKSQDSGAITVTFKSTSITLDFKPFRLTARVDGEIAMVLNGRDMFNFEHRRPKPEDGGPECDGCWEETFISTQDTKKNGPEAISLDISFPGFQHVYGIPEHATSMALKPTVDGEPYRMYNLDVFEYLVDHYFGLYGSIPFMLAHKMGLTTGVLWLNAAEMFIDVEVVGNGTATQWVSEGGIIDLYIFAGPSPADVTAQYALLTGTTALPQLFSLGYHQCRWNYKDEADSKAVNAGFDEHAIPYDVLWLDIEHTNGKR